eukprot:CAMPEP_0171845656 /NCGR_PEP_ID=MMETSP0992-20121227/17233_1 /TAXON_ID=483369 /ORGANISM="non described non described, Strain CCMP2098" /LENGTH=51 /DNA_ID=CAMNT_0012463761 /DNA_START=57 /DNA_END=212 /DNA_ORIENTATION=-
MARTLIILSAQAEATGRHPRDILDVMDPQGARGGKTAQLPFFPRNSVLEAL